ncbi:DNA ligase D [Xanthomonas sp. AmX2]|uniref:DNA ligase D n=1 Tax=Xanthomonas sp. TaxID=29446 RepID=UPI001980714E|nr:DNA ligase D [Xanthomonas sp.]MBN6150485.1 DNA ligase D [Xanthomonas sp.]
MSLRDYVRKRRFDDGTPEPAGDEAATAGPSRRPIFVVQLHHASSRHYDFRLEADGVLKSWAVPKGPSLRAGEKRLAVEVEDHPLSYAGFAGDIPQGHYGAGHVEVFDHGTWDCAGDPLQALDAGKLEFALHGERLHGAWTLVRTAMRGKQRQWLLIKRDDAHAADREADDLVRGAAAAAPARRTPPRARAAAASAAPAARKVARRGSSTPARPPRKRRDADAAWRQRALALPGAVDRPYPAGFQPQLTASREAAPSGEQWLHEIKWDGYRLLADLVDGTATLRSRSGVNWTETFPDVTRAVQALPVTDARLDGELVVLDRQGRSDFTALQKAIDGSAPQPLRYVVFDLPGVAGVDISQAPLLERKQLLKALVGDTPGIVAYSDHVLGRGPEVFAASGEKGFEGIVSKRIDAPYTPTRAPAWAKIKHENTDDFVVVGYTGPKGARTGFGSLLLAQPQAGGGWRYVGRVGTGFDQAMLAQLLEHMRPLEAARAALSLPAHVPFAARSVRWIEPKLVAEVAFRGWAKEGLLRQAAFKRLRDDKPLQELVPAAAATAPAPAAPTPRPTASATKAKRASRAAPKPRAAAKAARPDRPAPAAAADAVTITHPERVVYPQAGVTKGQVADYYRQVARWVLPEIAGRPLSLLRCPDGVEGECFFQKHQGRGLGAHVHAIPLQQKSGREDYVYVEDVAGLLELVQMNTLELHPWGSRIGAPEQPDRLVFDLDPGEGVDWAQVQDAAREIRARLRQAGLESFVRLSGGKGLHVVAPIVPGPDWDAVRAFCEGFAQALVAHAPQRYLATMSKAQREGKIFVDWLRNGRGNTSVCSWSLRARPQATVAMPLRWDELAQIAGPGEYTLERALQRAARLRKDPWDGIDTLRQALPGG